MEEYSELKTSGILDHLVTLTVNGEKLSYIQVHPTFLYEGLWNLLILLCIFLYRKHKKFDGELLCIYLMGYGAGRFFIEGLRVRPAYHWTHRNCCDPGSMYLYFCRRTFGHDFRAHQA